jgi:hypothetical protein
MATLRQERTDDPGERLARTSVQTQALIREVNEQIHQLQDHWSEAECRVICECPDPDCLEPFQISRTVYESVRGSSTRFIVSRGHQTTNHRPVEEGADYEIVEIIGAGVEVAKRLDPRARRMSR